jgi:delta 1-pyrroline-5-carboxylate dehydrogenase
MLIVLGVSMIINTIIDNFLKTKILAENLRVHPAVILVGALIGVQLFGFIGIVIAAPIMASLQLFLHYLVRKLSDQDPWKDLDLRKSTEKAKWIRFLEDVWQKIKQWFVDQFIKIKDRVTNYLSRRKDKN